MFPHEGLDSEREGSGEEQDLAFAGQVVDHTVQHTLEILNKIVITIVPTTYPSQL